jgi:hypothetical protein
MADERPDGATLRAERRRKAQLRRKKKVHGDKMHEEIKGMLETSQLENASFSEARALRFLRLQDAVTASEKARLLGTQTWQNFPAKPKQENYDPREWRQTARELLDTHTRQNEQAPLSLWNLVCNAEDIRMSSHEECVRDGYVPGHGLLVVKGAHTLSCGRAPPVKGDFKHTAFLSEYWNPELAAADETQSEGGEQGIKSVAAVNDNSAVVMFELAKVIRKLDATCAMFDKVFAAHLMLRTEALGKLEDLR